MSKIRRLASETVVYGLGNIVPRLINFFLFPIHTGIFDPDDYGAFTILMSFVGVMNVVYSFGMETAYFRYASKPDADPKRVFNIAQTTVIFISTFLSLIFILFSSSFAEILDVKGHGDFIVWLSVIMFIDNIVSIPFARLRFEKKPLLFAFFRISNVVILTGLNLYFLYYAFDPAVGIGYIFLANLIANSFYIIFFFKTFISWRPTFDSALTPSMFTYAFPVMITGLAGMMNEFFSRLSLKEWLPENFYPGRSSEYAVGVFGGCYKFSVIMSLAVTAFRMAGEPFFFTNASDKKSPELFARVNYYFIIVCCVIMLGVSINTDILKLLLRKKSYWEALPIVPPLMLGYLFLGVYYNFTAWFKLTDRTYFGTIITVGGAILTFVLNWLLIPIAGYYGSSWVTAIVYGAMMIACYLIGQKYYPIPYQVLSGISYITLTYLLIVAVNSFSFSNQIQATAFHTLIIVIYCGFIFLIERKKLYSKITPEQG
ncbi:polysaccharide biosynthesis protein [Cytophagales bacterium WSM2-2]|nr:polysaccharide biosynthesis protein [Cytophagales bacterium WSM2-2]